jgi:hypothetical protein
MMVAHGVVVGDAPLQVSGLMLANHTCMSQLFARSVAQFDRIRKRNAFIDNYRKEPIFADNLDEFDHRYAHVCIKCNGMSVVCEYVYVRSDRLQFPSLRA